MNAFFQDNFIVEKELKHLTKEVKRKQLAKTINAINCFNEMQNRIIKEKSIDTQFFNKMKQNNGKHF